MKLPYSWLAELVEGLPSPVELESLLTLRGFEVEEMSSPGAEIQDVVIAKILERDPHPNADKLSLCQVTDGAQTYRIVCGANNMQAGDRVALARLGAVLPGNFTIEKRKIRGEASEGMMCSTRELGLGEEHSGIMILPQEAPLGERLVDFMGLNDTIFEINVTPNRPDVLSALGIAREAAAACDGILRLPNASEIPAKEQPEFEPIVELIDGDLCPRYTGLVIRNVKIGPSPGWVQKRLEACGVRSINNVVDATNLTLMELGQPLHAFDYDKLFDNKIVVRRAVNGEMIVTIDGDTRILDDSMLVIADGQYPVAVAGVMGGLLSEVGEGTSTILLESAYFTPSSIRRTAKKLGLSSEASYRFERGVDLETVIPAAWRCAHLIAEMAGGRIAGRMTVADTNEKDRLESLRGRELALQIEYADRLLGKRIAPEEMVSIFNALNLKVLNRDAASITVRTPSYRQDIVREADLVEEVARCHGYDNFASAPLLAPVKYPERMRIDRHMMKDIRNYFTSLGLDECVTYSFTDPERLPQFMIEEGPVQSDLTVMQNPISTRENTMRTAVAPSLLNVARHNIAHGNNDFGLFEMARCYLPQNGDVSEKNVVAGVIVGNPARSWKNPKAELDFFDLKGDVEGLLSLCGVKKYRTMNAPEALHPKRSVGVLIGKQKIGYYGELSPSLAEAFELPGRVLLFELELQPLTEAFRNFLPQYRLYSAFPAVRRDLALLVPRDVTARQIEEIIVREGGEIVEEVEMFDFYKGKQVAEGFTSLGFRVTFRSMTETLTEETVDAAYNRMLAALQKELDVQRRS